MTIQIGTAPVSYGIFGTSGDRNAGETLLDSAAAAGFSGLELGPPALFGTPRETAEGFHRRGLEIVGSYIPIHLAADDATVVIDLANGQAHIVGAVPCGYVYVDGSSVGALTEVELKDRRILGEEGFISIVVVVDSGSGKVVAGPEIHARGFAEDETVFNDVLPRIVDAIAAAASEGVGDTHQLQQLVRRVVGRWVNESYRRRPMIIPLVVEA